MSERPSGPNKPAGPGPRPGLFGRNPFLIILLIVAFVIILNTMLSAGGKHEIAYSALYDYVEAEPEISAPANPGEAAGGGETAPGGEVTPGGETTEGGDAAKPEPRVRDLVLNKETIRGILRPKSGDTRLGDPKLWDKKLKDGELHFFAQYENQDKQFLPLLRSRGIKFRYEKPMDWTLWIWVLPLILVIFILLVMFRTSRMQGENVLSFGRSKAKIVGEEKTGVTFQDVAGADEAKEELTEIVEFLKEPERFTNLGGKIPKGCLLFGQPGCGKTLLARAVAGEAGVPFFSISGSDFVEMFVGVGAARVRDLFNTAKQKAPCIVFVDEIDAVGRHRGAGMGGGHDEREQTLNQLLVEMDGFDARKGVIVIAATNRPDILDPALLRPGRFDRQVVLDAPDLRGRAAVLRIHSRGKPLDDTVDLDIVARRTPGFTGADLANVMNESALLAARRRQTQITMQEVSEAIERVVAGPERRSRIIGPREKRILAYHELGHALVARFSEHADKVHKVSIIPRGRGALGYTLTLPDEDRYIITKEELIARIRVTLGGRSAEEVVFGHKSTGAEDDLQKVTQLARSIACRWGMTDELGAIAYERAPGNPFLGRDQNQAEPISEATAEAIDRIVKKMIEEAHHEAREILTTNRRLLDRLADLLMEREVLDLNDFEEAVQEYAETTPPPLPEMPDVTPPAAEKTPDTEPKNDSASKDSTAGDTPGDSEGEPKPPAPPTA